MTRQQVDWKLFRACLSLLCGNDHNQLARLLKVHPTEARHLLNGLPVVPTLELFHRACGAMHLAPTEFRKGWEAEFFRRNSVRQFQYLCAA